MLNLSAFLAMQERVKIFIVYLFSFKTIHAPFMLDEIQKLREFPTFYWMFFNFNNWCCSRFCSRSWLDAYSVSCFSDCFHFHFTSFTTKFKKLINNENRSLFQTEFPAIFSLIQKKTNEASHKKLILLIKNLIFDFRFPFQQNRNKKIEIMKSAQSDIFSLNISTSFHRSSANINKPDNFLFLLRHKKRENQPKRCYFNEF